MSNLNFISINGEVININYINEIFYDESIDSWFLSIVDRPREIILTVEQYEDIVKHLKQISNSYICI